MKNSRIEVQAAGSQILLVLLHWWFQNHCQVGRDHTLTKIISAKGWGPFIAGPKKSKTREDRITSAVDWDTLGKSTPRLQSLTVKAKLTTWWVFTVLCHSFSHSGETKWRPLCIFPLKKCQWNVQSLSLQDRGWAHSDTSLLELLVSAGSITWQLDTLVY